MWVFWATWAFWRLSGVGGGLSVWVGTRMWGAPYLVVEGARDGVLLVLVCSLCFWLKVEVSNSFNSDGHRVGVCFRLVPVSGLVNFLHQFSTLVDRCQSRYPWYRGEHATDLDLVLVCVWFIFGFSWWLGMQGVGWCRWWVVLDSFHYQVWCLSCLVPLSHWWAILSSFWGFFGALVLVWPFVSRLGSGRGLELRYRGLGWLIGGSNLFQFWGFLFCCSFCAWLDGVTFFGGHPVHVACK